MKMITLKTRVNNIAESDKGIALAKASCKKCFGTGILGYSIDVHKQRTPITCYCITIVKKDVPKNAA
jgi:hypothetical protein